MAKQSNEIMEAAKVVCEEKHISLESVIETIEAALAVAYRKDFGEKNQNIKVEFDMEDASSRVFDVKTVVTDEKKELTEKMLEEKMQHEEAAGPEESKPPTDDITKSAPPGTEASDDEEDVFERFNPKTEIALSDAKEIKKTAKVGDEIKTELHPSAAYGRMAAQTAKQVIIQRLREAERDNIYKEYKDKEGDVINGTVQRLEGRMVLIDLGQATAILPPSEQVPTEHYSPGQRLKFYVVAVNTTSKGPEIVLSRGHAEMVRKLFSLEVPEISNGAVEIRSIAREAGSRTKLAVFTDQKNIDPVGSCVGQRGARVQTIISEIGGEKIDIIEWDEDPVKFIINALSPAKVLSVTINDEEKTAMAEVKEDQLSLAIGKAGQNVRLSAKLTGWKIDIVSENGEKVSAHAKKTADKKREEKADKDNGAEVSPPTAEPTVEPEQGETTAAVEVPAVEPEQEMAQEAPQTEEKDEETEEKTSDK